ncbi:MAG: hypothetical protein IT573_00485 [Deltaproteobacteria bacterium]|nr:hypothetical protein [Deltaproteobacteria bacterium]
MKKLLTSLSVVLLLSNAALFGSGCGGGGAPPASIPAPVTQLMTISEPGPTGAVSITGAPGAVQPNANVQAQNVDQVGPFTWLKELLIRSAHAQTFFVEVTADDQGAFNLLIDGTSGDRIDIRQEVNGEFSPAVSLTVP